MVGVFADRLASAISVRLPALKYQGLFQREQQACNRLSVFPRFQFAVCPRTYRNLAPSHPPPASRQQATANMSKGIDRITMFRIPNEADIPAALEQYKILARDQKKDGKPYILSCQARKAHPDPRSKGFNLIAQTTFASLDDMKYYDQTCEAHAALKKAIGPLVAQPVPDNMMTLYLDRE